MHMLVTGAAGLYGTATVSELLESGTASHVFALDSLSRGFLRTPFAEHAAYSTGGKLTVMERDFRTLRAQDIDAMNLDAIIHFAAHVSIDESMQKPQMYFENNELGTFAFCRKLLASKTKPALIYASSPEVYGNPLQTPMPETHPMAPRSVYAVTKLAAEKHCLSLFEWHGYNVNIIRNFNTYGPNQNLEGRAAAIPSFINRALKGEPLSVAGNGEQTRDFLYVKDAARAYALLAEKCGEISGETFNIGTGKQTAIRTLAEKVIEITGSRSEIVSEEPRPGDLHSLEADISKISGALNWKPEYSLDKGLQETLNWYKRFVK